MRPGVLVTGFSLLALAWPVPARGQTDVDPAAEIIRDYGTRGELARDGLRTYFRDLEFLRLDLNGDGQLDFDEYREARLFVRQKACLVPSNASKEWELEKEAATGPINAATLDRINTVWKLHLDEMVAAHWSRTKPSETETLTLDAVRNYLRGEQDRGMSTSSAEGRLKTLLALVPAGSDVVPEQALRQFFRDERFAAVDLDGNNRLDFFEFAEGFTYPGAPSEFCRFANADFVITKTDFDNEKDRVAKAPDLHHNMNQYISEAMKNVTEAALDVPVALVKDAFERQAEAARRAAAIGGVGGHGFVKGFGYLLKGNRKKENGTIGWNRDRTSVFLRVIKDFTIDAPTRAEPAVFAIGKETGKPATYAVDAAVQLDVRPASATVLNYSFGVDVERRTAADAERNRQRYYGSLDLFLFKGGHVLESHYIRIAPFIDNNELKKTTRLAGNVIWQPGIHIGSFVTSTWKDLGRGKWFFTPRVVLELATALRKPADAVAADETHGRLELLWGFAVATHFEGSFKAFQRWGLGNDLGHSHFEELAAWWNIDELGRFSLKGSASWGQDTPSSPSTTVFNLGLGVRF